MLASSACHSLARKIRISGLAKILSLYDQLVELDESPLVALNRAVVIAKVHGPEAGLRAGAEIQNRKPIISYHLFHAVRADFHFGAGKPSGSFGSSTESTCTNA
jgi:RNA polymerase sigma-70 factor, ECF subfamily